MLPFTCTIDITDDIDKSVFCVILLLLYYTTLYLGMRLMYIGPENMEKVGFYYTQRAGR